MSARFNTPLAVLVALIVVAEIAFSWNPDAIGQALAASSVIVALAHGTLAYGWKNALAFCAITLAVSLIIENIGTATGLPFGHYHFVVTAGLPYVGRIPLIVGFLWFGMGYSAWHVAAALLDNADARLRQNGNLVVLPLIAAIVMTQWDFVMDRGNSTIARAWVWHDGGADFGVPPINYAGWLLTSWTFYQLVALWLARASVAAPKPSLRLAAIAFYAAAGLSHLVPWALGPSGEVDDVGGHIWRVADIRAMSALVMLVTMGFSATLAAIKIVKEEQRRTKHLAAP